MSLTGLSVDTGVAQTTGRNPRLDNRAQVHAARSVTAGQPIEGDSGEFSSDEDEGNGQQYASEGTNHYGDHNHYTHHSQQGLDDEEEEMSGGMEDEEDEEEYDEDEDDDMSSSPSIPDENIDFDLVYALHTFVATVEGQATVNKGSSLTLLDDSNSYWWLVRVLRTQEVGYIPAENIETPYERLARLNKHRNVDLTAATDHDHIQVPNNINNSHLYKRRDESGFSEHSGKLSALSQRRDGVAPGTGSRGPSEKPSVMFGPPQYVEHSGDEFETEDEGEDGMYADEDELEAEREEEEEEEEAAEGEEEENDLDEDQVRAQMEQGFDSSDHSEKDVMGSRPDASVESQMASSTSAPAQSAALQQRALASMEPDDGMSWDNSQRAQRARAPEQQQQNTLASFNTQDTQSNLIGQEPIVSNQQSQQLALGQQRSGESQPVLERKSSLQRTRDGSQQQRPREQMVRPSTDRSISSSSVNSAEGPLSPSRVQAGRERTVSETSGPTLAGPTAASAGGVYGRGSPMPVENKKDKTHKRKSKGSMDTTISEDSAVKEGDEKSAKKRSGVFSGLFSRNKDKKDRKSASISSVNGGEELSNVTSRTSDDSNRSRQMSPAIHAVGANGIEPGTTDLSRGVQDRDRAQQEAYQRQFLTDRTGGQGGPRPPKPRPGSLVGPSGSAPELSVMRVFAGEDVKADATFKTVLLNPSTSARDLVKQAMQRFRLHHGDFVLTVKLFDGDERILLADEKPLQVFEHISALTPHAVMMPSVKRSSVGSITSISSNLSLNPAIARVNGDFSDDHAVKFFLKGTALAMADTAPLNEQSGLGAGNMISPLLTPGDSEHSSYFQTSTAASGLGLDRSPDMSLLGSNVRFAVRVLIFPSDLPEGVFFDPQTNAVVPREVLDERSAAGLEPADDIEHRFRERVLSVPRNTTVAEAIEQSLDRFGIADSVVEGGDDVEDRTSRRRGKPRTKYSLTVEVKKGGTNDERRLAPNSKIIDAFSVTPNFKTLPTNKRRSADSAMLLNMAGDAIRPEDPTFILRSVSNVAAIPGKQTKAARALSPTEGRLADRQDQRRRDELDSIPDGSTTAATHTPASPAGSRSRQQEVIAAQRAVAQERKAAVLGAQRNDQQGVDLYLANQARIRSSRSNGKMRYSYLPQEAGAGETDISSIVEDILADQRGAPAKNTLQVSRPGGPLREASIATLNSFHSAHSTAGTPSAFSGTSDQEDPWERSTTPQVPGALGGSTAPLSVRGGSTAKTPPMSPASGSGSANRDLLETFVRNPENQESTIEDRIDQVMARMTSEFGQDVSPYADARSTPTGARRTGAPSYAGATPRGVASQGRLTPGGSHLQDGSMGSEYSSVGSQRPGSTNTTNPTPTSMLAATAGTTVGLGALAAGSAAGVLAGAAIAGGALLAGTRAMDQTSSSSSTGTVRANGVMSSATRSTSSGHSMAESGPAAYVPADDFGLEHLYTIVDAAMRRDPKKYIRSYRSGSITPNHPVSGAGAGSSSSPLARSSSAAGFDVPSSSSVSRRQSRHSSMIMTLAPEREIIRPQVAGLFAPSLEGVGEASRGGGAGGETPTIAVYGPLGKQLDQIEDNLDRLLAEALKL